MQGDTCSGEHVTRALTSAASPIAYGTSAAVTLQVLITNNTNAGTCHEEVPN